MIGLMIASAINLAGLQASISAPTDAFRGCLRDAAIKAKGEHVTGDGIDAYLRNACVVQGNALKDAVIAFRTKNGMSRKDAIADASGTVDDYVSTPAENYKFMAQMDAPKPQTPPTLAATPPPTPAATPSQPPKP